MKLKIYNAENSAIYRQNVPVVRLNVKSGLLAFSAAAVEKMNLSPGKGIVIANDEESPRDWFIHITPDPAAYKLRTAGGKSKRGFLFCNSTAIVRSVFSSLKIESTSIGFMISQQPIIEQGLEYWLIITAKPFGKK